MRPPKPLQGKGVCHIAVTDESSFAGARPRGPGGHRMVISTAPGPVLPSVSDPVYAVRPLAAVTEARRIPVPEESVHGGRPRWPRS